MSNAIYPTLPGLLPTSTRSIVPPPVQVRTTPAQREYRARDAVLPRYRYSLQYEFLRHGRRGTELATLVGFYAARGGSFDTWLYLDPVDNAVTAQVFGTGNGVTTAFQLLRTFGGFAEQVYDLVAAPQIYRAGVLATSGYTVSATGLVTFSTAPGAGVALTWTGSYYRRCRFEGQQLDTDRFMEDLFSARRVEFISTKA